MTTMHQAFDASAPNNANAGVASNAPANARQPMSFKAVIELKEQVLNTNGVRYPLAAGMQLGAEIVEGKRTVLQYLLSPVQRVTDEAGRER
ncbi:MAG: hypothetical protein V9E93_17555 [Steroidobacteraceae bacterium]|nr:hypothetical protein [Pseudomonadota bacterium]